jgi:hypothetical protein
MAAETEMVMQRVAPAGNASQESIRTSVVNRYATPASISKIGPVPLALAHFARFVVAYNITVILGRLRARNWIRGRMRQSLASLQRLLLVLASADRLFATHRSGVPLSRKRSFSCKGTGHISRSGGHSL